MKLEEQESDTPETPEGETTVLEDLMLQAEIFLQYSMRAKSVERLERIHKLFPREEEKIEKLHDLYMSAGFTPRMIGLLDDYLLNRTRIIVDGGHVSSFFRANGDISGWAGGAYLIVKPIVRTVGGPASVPKATSLSW